MSALNHFQTYSQRENHVTNNTMLMLRHIYRAAPSLLENVLQALLEEDEVEIGPRFEQQVGAAYSVPDAVLSQKSLNVYVEAKRGDDLYDDQLERHMRSIFAQDHPKNSAFLIGLTSNDTNAVDDERWIKKASEFGITFAATTYRELLEAFTVVCTEITGLREILDDYQSFIASEGLLPNQYRKLAAMLCGQSWRENIAYGAYFEPAYRNPKWTRAHYIGVYRQKRVSHVGRLLAAAVCVRKDNAFVVEATEFGTLTEEHKNRINSMIDAVTYYHGFASEPHRYYIVDEFAETDLRKTSSGGMMGHRYLDIEDLAGTESLQHDASSKDIASRLNGKTYE